MAGIKRAFIRRKLEQKIEDLSPSKFAATTFVFADDDDLSKSSLLDKSAVMSDAPFVITSDKSRDDDGVDDDDDVLRDGHRVGRNSTPPDPVHVTVTTTPQSFLHGMIIIEDELGITAHSHVQVTPTPKKGDGVVHQGKLFESSPITQPDEYGKMQGLSFVDESLDYSINDDTPLPTPLHDKMKKNDSSSPSMFQSSPLNTQPDDSLLQESLSSFIRNDDSMLTLERELFDCTISINKKKEEEEDKEAPTKTLYVDTKIDMSEPIRITTKKKETPLKTITHDTKVDMRETIEPLFKESPLMRAKQWPTWEQDEGDDECDDNPFKSSLGLNSSRQLHPSTIKKDNAEDSSSSPTGVADFIDEIFFPSSLPPLPQLHHSAPAPANTSPKTTLMSRLWDQAIGGCHPFDTIGCKVGHCSSDKPTKKKKKQQQQQQQQPAATVAQTCCAPAPPFASSPMKRPGRVQRVYSPAEELSLARQNAHVAQQQFERRSFK